MADELPRKTILAWRAFAATPEFEVGLTFLRQKKAPAVSGKTAIELLESALKWGAYFEALDDLTETLCVIPTPEDSAEDPGLEKI